MGLFGIMSIAEQSLEAQQSGLQVTANNIANVNTPGYSRRVAELAEQAPFSPFTGSAGGGGVTLQKVQDIRDSVLEIRLNQETSNQNSLTSLQQQMQPVEALFNAQGGAGLGTAMDNFYAALQQLSTNPANGAQRQSVITSAQTLTETFNQVANGISQQVAGANQYVVQDVSQVNTLTSQIATLNGQVAALQNLNQNAAALVDQRGTLLNNLSQLMDFTQSDGGNGEVTLTTSGGQALVVGTNATALTTQANGNVQDVYSGATDITSTITGGSLAGLIQARDTDLPNLASQVDALATTVANGINQQNALGFDLNGAAGGNLFAPPTAANAAANMAMATTDPAKIAASASAANTGDNTNVLAMASLQNQPNASGLTPDDAYAGIVSSVGTVVQSADTQQQASLTVLTQLQNQRSAYSGVSIDEESINLTQFQQAYQAAARVVTTVNTLTTLAINLGQD
ncbi:MAG: flagellar hook-associated protein FlgK [Terriglobales bacterium]